MILNSDNIPFVKYQGTGNDFILIDGRFTEYSLDVAKMCDRRFGIGADGLMILKLTEGYDFEMIYYNSDGNLSSMCGNGGRCIAHWAHSLGLSKDGRLSFYAPDGAHEALVEGNWVKLRMIDVLDWEIKSHEVICMNTGSPHFVHFNASNSNESINAFDLVSWAKGIRYSDEYQKEGINVNRAVVTAENALSMRTYERGVEDETYSCGTGVTAAALSYAIMKNLERGEIYVSTRGGDLSVNFEHKKSGFVNIWLNGPAEFVFNGLY